MIRSTSRRGVAKIRPSKDELWKLEPVPRDHLATEPTAVILALVQRVVELEAELKAQELAVIT